MAYKQVIISSEIILLFSYINILCQSFEWYTINKVIKYQKHDSLGEIMYKLDEPKEKKKFFVRELISIAICFVMCLFACVSRSVYTYA